MQRILIALFTLLGISTSALAQFYTIEGQAVSANNEAVPYATVILYNSGDSSLAKTGMTGGNGNYRIPGVKTGNYFITIKILGMKDASSSSFQLDKNKTIPTIIMRENTEALDEVTVTTAKPLVEVLPDKTVFNVQSSLTSTGTSGFELLRKAPGVIIDNNDNVILEGKTGIQIYVDGKPLQLAGDDLANYLKNIRAEEIESVELITQPSAKFDAAGSAGIINIRFKKDLRFGTNGTVSAGYAQGKYGRLNSSLLLNYRNKKINFYGNYSNSINNSESFLDLKRTQVNTIFDQKSTTYRHNLNHGLRAGVDYFASSKSTFGLMVNGNYNYGQTETNTRTPITPLSTGETQEVLVAQTISDMNNVNLFINANYRYEDTLGRGFSADFDYGRYRSDRDNFQPNFYKNDDESIILLERIYRMVTPLEIDIYSLKADYEFNLGKVALATGAKVSQVNTDNTFRFYDVISSSEVLNDNRSNTFIYEEQIAAAYMNASYKWEKLSMQVGLRAENTKSRGTLNSTINQKDSVVDRNYLNWFPSGGITYIANRKNSFSLTYSRRITRPNYQSLNPFEYTLDELSYSKGNPFLQPQYIHNSKLSHTYNYRLTTSVSYSYVEDYFAQITDTIEGNRNFLTSRNVADQKVLNLSVSYPFSVKKWWNVYFSVSGYKTWFEANDPSFKPLSQATMSLYAQNTFSLPKEWSLEISGWFSSPSIWGGTYLTKSLGSLDLAIQKRFLKDKLSVRLAFSDILYTSPWRAEMEYGALSINGTGGYDSRQIRLNLSYNFGNRQMKSVKLRDTGAKEESERLN